jgi:hypothetical protein
MPTLVWGGVGSAEDTSDKFMSEEEAKAWLNQLPNQITTWLQTIQHQPATPEEPWGLFTFSKDSEVPYGLPSTALAWLVIQSLGGIEKYPGCPPDARKRMAMFLQKFQEPKTGFFIDPLLEARLKDKDEESKKPFRADITKWTGNLIGYCGSAPLYSYSSGGEGGVFDGQAYLAELRNADWTKPWHVCSYAGFQTRELFDLINSGHEEHIPVLKEGLEIILRNQNPKTGMWGREDLPIDQQLGGALKVIGRFHFGMGFVVPRMNQLADSLIKIRRGPDFSQSCSDTVVIRNVAELAYACIEASDYRKQELRQVMVDLLTVLRKHQQPDGGFSRLATGKDPIVFHGAAVAPASAELRGDIHGVQSTLYALENTYHWLGWTGGPWPERPDWREELAGRNYKYVVTCNDLGEVTIQPKD